MKRTRIFVVGVFLGTALAFSGCGHKAESGTAPSLPTASVRVQTVESKKRVATEEVVGTVRAKLRSVVEGKASGKLEQMLVVPGQNHGAGSVGSHHYLQDYFVHHLLGVEPPDWNKIGMGTNNPGGN